ncbi:hypothetical protein CDAR_11621 [Caerostris darwini]|uniref:Uncharacterized protein n=1 Tax=Caerostris darwini TaxID=1538125 RepID=A0AAV4RAZ9_9ARAC|nr:hypothetical protein CDAR_11621 [Caerostris darwini]
MEYHSSKNWCFKKKKGTKSCFEEKKDLEDGEREKRKGLPFSNKGCAKKKKRGATTPLGVLDGWLANILTREDLRILNGVEAANRIKAR